MGGGGSAQAVANVIYSLGTYCTHIAYHNLFFLFYSDDIIEAEGVKELG